ncbi:MAG: HNH endonuclease [Chloroflexi bacterium OLB13]|nr:MAG: HNH endonuclease [Chloroflexi bacterium OLB13]
MKYSDRLHSKALERYASQLNSRARAAGSPGAVTADELRGVVLDSGGRCSWCGASVVNAEFEIDHILGVVRGGPNIPANLALACPDCNKRKAFKHPARFAAEVLARGAPRTPFIDRVLERYGGDDPGMQGDLFADDLPPGRAIRGDDLDEDPAPYVW